MEPAARDDPSLPTLIGSRVRGVRTERGSTLDDLAERSRVSRRMVVNVEQGLMNASISTLLRLSTALGVSLASLVDMPESIAVAARRKGSHPAMWEGEFGGQALLVSSTRQPDVVELWDWTLGPKDEHASEAHSSGTRELLHVLNGTVRIMVGNESVSLRAGDALWFAGDQPHSYANDGKAKARFSLTVHQPGVGI